MKWREASGESPARRERHHLHQTAHYLFIHLLFNYYTTTNYSQMGLNYYLEVKGVPCGPGFRHSPDSYRDQTMAQSLTQSSFKSHK
jgi:hypothetical protein